MLRGHIARQRGGRRRVLSAINAKAAWLYGPCVRLGPLAYVTGHKPRDSSGSRRARPGHVLAPDPYSCRGPPRPRTLPRPEPYSKGPGAYSRDPACPLGSSGPVRTGVRCPSEVRTHRCTSGCIIFPCHVVPLVLPMWWGWVPLSV
jgi:hypothetical protein